MLAKKKVYSYPINGQLSGLFNLTLTLALDCFGMPTQGQEVHAIKLLIHCMTTGHWLLLQNCHLNIYFCQDLLDTVLEAEMVRPSSFQRLWNVSLFDA